MFWSTQLIKAKQKEALTQRQPPLVDPFDENRVGQGHYELLLSRQALVSPDPESLGEKLIRGILNPSKFDQNPVEPQTGPTLTIPAGQFALLYTKESVNIPKNVLSFISIKAKIKLKGLVNISGFHVDPGFSGRIKFSVYNAGNSPLFLAFDEPFFLLWFSDLNAIDEKPYDCKHGHYGQTGITCEDREQMSEPSQSPAALNKRLENVENSVRWIGGVIALVVVPLLISLFIVIFQHAYEYLCSIGTSKPPALVQTNGIPNPNPAQKP